jgi:hypothetical protein
MPASHDPSTSRSRKSAPAPVGMTEAAQRPRWRSTANHLGFPWLPLAFLGFSGRPALAFLGFGARAALAFLGFSARNLGFSWLAPTAFPASATPAPARPGPAAAMSTPHPPPPLTNVNIRQHP